MDKIEQALEVLEDAAGPRERQALATLRAELAGMKADAEKWRHYIKELRAGIVTALSQEQTP